MNSENLKSDVLNINKISKNLWDKAQITVLINAYQLETCLYAVNDKDYHNRDLRGSAIRRICETISKVHPNVTEKECAIKINTLRNTFNIGNKKVKESIKSGVGVDDVNINTILIKIQITFFKQNRTKLHHAYNFFQLFLDL